ncbi:hypothetical protein Gogos_019959 [Gossypium gossypioides]|uniref:Uncharacterized protein n=1 Tax=Gossypium gossypioides TaxID=34282 RepID=A0A7J9D7I5_GOSGO|nr:hypothetical protein [Gossypium gossypioides]
MEEYTTLLRCPNIQADKAYSRAANVPTFLKKRMNITGMTLGHIDETVSDLFDRLDKRVEKVFYEDFSENYFPLKELVATPKRHFRRKVDNDSPGGGRRMESPLDDP